MSAQMVLSLTYRSLVGIMDEPHLQVTIGGMTIKNPVMTASGTFGYGLEYAPLVNLNKLGAIVVKGTSLRPRPGNTPPRIAETPCGMLNAIGLENIGLNRFAAEVLPQLRKYQTSVVVNVLGESIEEYVEIATRLNELEGVSAIEVNISCPNVKKGGILFGTDPKMAHEVTSAVRRHTRLPVIIKLSPNVTDITVMARAVEEGGADGVSLINTLLGMAIDVRTRRPKLGNILGGLSGPAIKPVALRMVWQAAKTVKIPVIGIGGISCTEDALEFLLAGATAVQVGTANFVDPETSERIIDGISEYLREGRNQTVHEIIGAVSL